MTATALPVRHAEECMGTVFSFDVRGVGVGWDEFDRVLAWLHETDARFSTYRADSEISRIADGTLRPEDAHPDVRRVLAACEEASVATDGYFSARPDGRLDPSGYVKGWAIDTASQMLVAAGSTAHCVNGGGDVSCHGRPDGQHGWRVGIADPFRRGAVLRTLQGAGPLGVATSGGAERGSHIVDPHDGSRPTDLVAVTVATDDVIRADVLATAAVARGRDGEAWLRSIPHVRAIVVRSDGTVTHTWADADWSHVPPA